MANMYTIRSTPFAFGGRYEIIRTTIEEYERVSIGRGYYGLIVHNTIKNYWHLCLEEGGALIGTAKTRNQVLAQVRNDVKTGNPKLMLEQIKQSLTDGQHGRFLELAEFFSTFR